MKFLEPIYIIEVSGASRVLIRKKSRLYDPVTIGTAGLLASAFSLFGNAIFPEWSLAPEALSIFGIMGFVLVMVGFGFYYYEDRIEIDKTRLNVTRCRWLIRPFMRKENQFKSFNNLEIRNDNYQQGSASSSSFQSIYLIVNENESILLLSQSAYFGNITDVADNLSNLLKIPIMSNWNPPDAKIS